MDFNDIPSREEKSDTDRINDLLEKRNIDLGEQKIKINIDKTSEFLNFFFQDDIKDVYSNFNKVKSILILQASYYIHVFKTLWNLKNKLHLLKSEIQLDTEKSEEEKKNIKLLPPITSRTFLSNRDNISKVLIRTSSKQFMNTNMVNKQVSNKSNFYFKIGIVGCGHIGTSLLKIIIKIKDSGYINCKIYVSTRRPDIINSELYNSLDDTIEIFLDNEKIFNECDLIFLCIQPHQLDLLVKEISAIFIERIDKLKKRKGKILPIIVSFLAGVTLEKLITYFPEEVNIFRTFLKPTLINKNDSIPFTNEKIIDYSLRFKKGNSLKVDFSSKLESIENSLKQFIRTSFEHFPRNLDFFQKFFILFFKSFYPRVKKEVNTVTSNFYKSDEGAYTLYMKEVNGENLLDYIDITNFQFTKSSNQEEIMQLISENYITIMNNIIRLFTD